MKRNRTSLKERFKKGSIPTEADFADLIDSTLNQAEDNLSKVANDPLHITATGVEEALLNFYRVENGQEALSWQIKQKPEGRAGLSISDTAAGRLFIQNATGNVGVGTNTPAARLDVQGEARTGTHSSTTKGLYVTGAFAADSGAAEFRKSDGTQGIGLGFNTIYASGSNPNQDLNLKPRGTGVVAVGGPLSVSAALNANGGLNVTGGLSVSAALSVGGALSVTGGVTLSAATTVNAALTVNGALKVAGAGLTLDGTQRLIFSGGVADNNLRIQLWDGFGFGINSSTLFYAASGNHAWRDTNGQNTRMLLSTAADGGLTVSGTGMSSFAGYVASKGVYFSAYLDLNTSNGALDPLPMKVAAQNVGNGWDTALSKFTAPVKGVYLFTMGGLRADAGTDALQWKLVVNGVGVNGGGNNTAESDERGLLTWMKTDQSNTRTMIVALNKDDKVWVVQSGSGRCDNYRSGLEGVLLNASV